MSAWILAAAAGLFAGVVHVLSGPDHLAAVLPFAIRDRRAALKVGLTWGIGHGLGVLLLASAAYVVRSTVQIEQFSSFAEAMVGAMLVLVGAWSIKQSRVVVIHEHAHGDHLVRPHLHLGRPKNFVHLHGQGTGHRPHQHHRNSVLGFGLLHGLAGAGHLLGVLPTVALGPAAAAAYLGMFLAGGLGAMGFFAFAAGRIAIKEAWLPRALAVSGGISIAVGAFWLFTMTRAIAG